MTEVNTKGEATQALAEAADTSKAATDEETLPGSEEAKETDVNENLPGTEEEKGEGEEEPKDEEEEQVGAPEEYADFDVSAGEDIGYGISDEQKEEFVAFGKDNNFTDKQMKSILQLDIKRRKEEIAGRKATNDKLIEEYAKEGINASRKEHGEKYGDMQTKNGITYNKFFSKEARTQLNRSGISSQPWFTNVLNNITNAISEDHMVPGESKKGKDLAKRTLAEAASPQT